MEFTDEIRNMLGVGADTYLVPDHIVMSPLNGGAAREMAHYVWCMLKANNISEDGVDLAYRRAFNHALCACICASILSRIEMPTYGSYRKYQWDKRRARHIEVIGKIVEEIEDYVIRMGAGDTNV